MIATEGGQFFAVPLPEAGTYPAWCYSLIDIGTIEQEYKGKISKGRRIYVNFEMPTLKASFGENKQPEPFVTGIELTLSTADRANLTKIVQNWRSKPFTPEEKRAFNPAVMVGKPALINVIHKRKTKFVNEVITEITNENTVLKFNGISSVPKGMEMPKRCNDKFIWDWDVQIKNFDFEAFAKIPEWLTRKIKTSDEFKLAITKLGMSQDNVEAKINEIRSAKFAPAQDQSEDDFDAPDQSPIQPQVTGW